MKIQTRLQFMNMKTISQSYLNKTLDLIYISEVGV